MSQKNHRSFSVLMAFFLALTATFAQQPADVDLSFNASDPGYGMGDGAVGLVRKIMVQANGGIFISGTFISYNGHNLNAFARLTPDGRFDSTFNFAPGPGSIVSALAQQPDGKLLLGGYFTEFNNSPGYKIICLHADGNLDTAFQISQEANSHINSVSVLPDGKIIVAGDFTSVNGILSNRIARFFANGTLDTGFVSTVGADNSITGTLIQHDGKILISGNFTAYNGVSRNRIARLNSDGSLDLSFDAGAGPDNVIKSMALQANGKLIIGGSFSSVNNIPRKAVARLHPNGGLDTSFTALPAPFTIGGVEMVAVQPDGKIIAACNSLNIGFGSMRSVVRLETNGGLDTTFDPGSGTTTPQSSGSVIMSAALQPDGRVLVGGNFMMWNYTDRGRLARLNANGTLDSLFNPATGASSSVAEIAVQPDGKTLIAGSFTTYNGTQSRTIARLHTNGSLDYSFNPGAGANEAITAMALQPDGKILIAGNFTNFNNIPVGRIARLNTDGSLDATFIIGTGANNTIESVALLPDGKILIGGLFTSFNGTNKYHFARLNANGGLDLSFNNNHFGPNDMVKEIRVLPDGSSIISGSFWAYNGIQYYNGNHLREIIKINADGTPDLTYFPDHNFSNSSKTTTLQPDGKLIVCYVGEYGLDYWYSVKRFNPDSSTDTSFFASGGSGYARKMLVQPNGKILIAEGSALFDQDFKGVRRLNADGSHDSTFMPGAPTNGNVYALALQPDGKILAGGNFTSFNGVGRNRLMRLLGDEIVSAPKPIPLEMSLYPNPASNTFFLDLSDLSGEANVEIYNLLGQQVLETDLSGGNTSEIKLTNTPAGTYVVKVHCAGRVFSQKLVVQQ